MRPLSEYLAMALVVLAAALFSARGHAEELELTPAQCAELSQVAEQAAEMRDVGADAQLYAALLRSKNPDLDDEVWAVLEQEIAMAFRSPLVPGEVGLEVLLRCHRLRGKMGLLI